MSYQQNEAEYIRRLEAERDTLQQELESYGNELMRIHDALSRALEDNPNFVRAILDNAPKKFSANLGFIKLLVDERDEARDVAQRMARHESIEGEENVCQFGCGEMILHQDGVVWWYEHAPDCPVTKVRAWDAPKSE